ncbi:MAG: lipase family protein [Pirellulales bacterium]|nr:lipase family protein [Pirellulales bacterium]
MFTIDKNVSSTGPDGSSLPMSNKSEVAVAPKIIQDAGEAPLVLHSDVRGPLGSLSFLRRALAMAELAMIAYNDEAEAQRAAAAIGFPVARLLDRDGSQAYQFSNEHDVVLACRGTEPTEWNDLQADANAVMSVVGAFGNVHSGFNREVDDLWPTLEDWIRGQRQPVWFCGHSLGAAMATICAYRCKASSIASDPQELHTFGSPRVGCRRYVRHAELTHFRWVHNNDVVTRVPPIWMGYRHSGKEKYLDRYGRIRPLKGVLRSRDRWRGLIGGLLKWQIDLLADHSIGQYAKHIATAVRKEEAKLLGSRV